MSYSVGKLLSGRWWVRHTYIESKEPLAVTFVVDDADNGPFIGDSLPGGADHPSYTIRLLEVTSTYLESRRVTLSVVMATGQPAEQAEGYAADMQALVQALSADEGAGIAVLRFDAFDVVGAPLVQERWNLDLGRHSSA